MRKATTLPTQGAGTVIVGNFRSNLQARRWMRTERLLVVLLGIVLFATLIVYGWSVQVETSVNSLAQETRQLNEENTDLQVQLNRVQSFKNLEDILQNHPYLERPQEIVDVRLSDAPAARWVNPAPESKELPRVYGY
jgi:hypothetical protein